MASHLGARARSAAARSTAVEKVIAAMRERLDAPFMLDEMARLAFLSPYYFNRVFRELTGVPPRRFQTALRMAAAKRLLLTTDLSVTEICLDLGYQSLGTFTTHFHELVGVSPRELRRLAGEPPCTPGQLVTALEQNADRRILRRGLSGRVIGPEAAGDWLVFVGLFVDACPQRLPSACTARTGPGEFRLGLPAKAGFHLAGVAFPSSDDPRSYLLADERELLLASCPAPETLDCAEEIRCNLRLRKVRPTDPPVLLALPMLLGRRVAERETLQAA